SATDPHPQPLEPLTIGAEFADPRIYHLINEKVDATDRNKPKVARKKEVNQPAQQQPCGSLLRAAELAESFENTESIAFHSKTTKERMHEKAVVRDCLG
ncbi:unnamed protein product, partial [Rotaria sp. Silwood1]